MDRLGDQVVTLFGDKSVIERCKHSIVSDQCTVTDPYTALILKLTACIDENAFTEVNVFAAVSIERGKQTNFDRLASGV